MYRGVITGVFVILLVWGVSIRADDLSHTMIFDLPADVALKMFGEVPGSALTREDSLAFRNAPKFDGDTFKVLVIPYDFTTWPHRIDSVVIDSMFFSTNSFRSGSIADYFKEISYGRINMVGKVLSWRTLPLSFFPSGNFFANLNASVDFSQFDGNSDGIVDGIVFVHAGPGSEDSTSQFPWSFTHLQSQNQLPLWGPFDGKMIDCYSVCPELRPLRKACCPRDWADVDSLSSILVYVHEMLHQFRVWDLYDGDARRDTMTYLTAADSNDWPLNDWCIMATPGPNWAQRATVPSHPCGYTRTQLGWIQPILLASGTISSLTIKDIESNQDSSLYKIPINAAMTEYFLLEYRNSQSSAKFDKVDADYSMFFNTRLSYGSDTLDRGLLISHVDESMTHNSGWPWLPHYMIAAEDAGYNPSFDYTHNPGGNVTDRSQWWYPYESRIGALFSSETPGQELFSPTTVPNSDSYYTGATGISVRVDSIVGDRIYASITQPDSDGDGVTDLLDNCAAIANTNQSDIDGDGIGDVCDLCPSDPLNDGDGDGVCAAMDNCPNVANAGQQDANHDGIGDACCCIGLTGNVDCDINNGVDISDLSALIDYMYITFTPLCCPNEANTDGQPGTDISDLSTLIDYLYISFTPVAACQ